MDDGLWTTEARAPAASRRVAPGRTTPVGTSRRAFVTMARRVDGRARIRVLDGITPLPTSDASHIGYIHEAVLYRGQREFLDGCVPFVSAAAAAGAPVLVGADAGKIEAMRQGLGSDATGVEFVVMTEAGRNPGRVISIWRDFVDRNRGAPCFGIGEPVWSARGRDELVECQQHEHLLNHAFSLDTRFHLRCPYDTETLGAAVLDEAIRAHPWLGGSPSNPGYVAVGGAELLQAPIDSAPAGARRAPLSSRSLAALRQAVALEAATAGLLPPRCDDAVLVADELATNALCHGAGPSTVAVWSDASCLTIEVRDEGRIADPLVGRRRPDGDANRGWGLWLVHELADLVQVRSAPGGGTVVRATFQLAASAKA
jgi:anti-sigma regulatory factor (Ser/Thr protein kinase)